MHPIGFHIIADESPKLLPLVLSMHSADVRYTTSYALLYLLNSYRRDQGEPTLSSPEEIRRYIDEIETYERINKQKHQLQKSLEGFRELKEEKDSELSEMITFYKEKIEPTFLYGKIAIRLNKLSYLIDLSSRKRIFSSFLPDVEYDEELNLLDDGEFTENLLERMKNNISKERFISVEEFQRVKLDARFEEERHIGNYIVARREMFERFSELSRTRKVGFEGILSHSNGFEKKKIRELKKEGLKNGDFLVVCTGTSDRILGYRIRKLIFRKKGMLSGATVDSKDFEVGYPTPIVSLTEDANDSISSFVEEMQDAYKEKNERSMPIGLDLGIGRIIGIEPLHSDSRQGSVFLYNRSADNKTFLLELQ